MAPSSCPQCGSVVHSENLSCASCGIVNQRSEEVQRMECECHSDERVVARCVVCGKPMCGDCVVRAGGMFFCDVPEHQRMVGAWSVVYECESEFEGDLIFTNLAHHDISCQVFALNNFVGVSWLKQRQIVRVLVPDGRVKDAKNVLASLGLVDDPEIHHL